MTYWIYEPTAMAFNSESSHRILGMKGDKGCFCKKQGIGAYGLFGTWLCWIVSMRHMKLDHDPDVFVGTKWTNCYHSSCGLVHRMCHPLSLLLPTLGCSMFSQVSFAIDLTFWNLWESKYGSMLVWELKLQVCKSLQGFKYAILNMWILS